MAANLRIFFFIKFAFTTLVASELQCETLGRAVTCNTGDDKVTQNKLDRGLVSDERNTLRITLHGCRITEISEDAFAGLSLLQYLDLSANRIEWLKPGVFEDAKKVTHLNLSHNFIEQLPEGFFENNPSLEILDLSSNSITQLRVGIFDPFTKLQYLDLSDNSLFGRHVDSHLFDIAINLRSINFSGNNMKNTTSMFLRVFKSLHNLNLSRCKLKDIPDFVTTSNLNTMRFLTLAENQISNLSNINTFKYLGNLEELSLVDNNIVNIEMNVFAPLRNLKKLLLGGNHIQLLPHFTFLKLRNLNTVDLSNNSIEEIDADYFKGTSVENLNLSGNKLTFLQENFCANMKASGRNLTKFSFDNNPWQCTCLLNILEEVKKLKIVYSSYEFNGRVSVCVATREFSCKRLSLELLPPFE